MIFDDSNAAAGGDSAYSFADIYAVLGGTGVDILRVDSGTGYPTYRLLKNLQIGDKTTNNATTTLQDSNVAVTFDAGKVLKCRATQTTNWNCIFGTKVGSGNKASGKNGVSLHFTNTAGTNTCIIRNKQQWYGVTAISTVSGGTQSLQFVNNVSGNGSELIDCIIQGFTQVAIGGSVTTKMDNIYNVDISGASSGTGSVLSSMFTNNAERVTIAMGGTQLYSLNTAANDTTFKDVTIFGTPVTADYRASSGSAAWTMVRPVWSGAAQKMDVQSANATCKEYWLYEVRCVTGDGAGVPDIPVRLTDTLGNVQVDTTTDANGDISYGSGLTANAIVMMDHYLVGVSTYTQTHRGPFLTEINMPYQTGYNRNYFSHRYYWLPPGYETITTSSGTFKDVSDIIQMSAVTSGGGSTWVEDTVP